MRYKQQTLPAVQIVGSRAIGNVPDAIQQVQQIIDYGLLSQAEIKKAQRKRTKKADLRSCSLHVFFFLTLELAHHDSPVGN